MATTAWEHEFSIPLEPTEEERIETLEAELAELKRQFADFRNRVSIVVPHQLLRVEKDSEGYTADERYHEWKGSGNQ